MICLESSRMDLELQNSSEHLSFHQLLSYSQTQSGRAGYIGNASPCAVGGPWLCHISGEQELRQCRRRLNFRSGTLCTPGGARNQTFLAERVVNPRARVLRGQRFLQLQRRFSVCVRNNLQSGRWRSRGLGGSDSMT
jgi:hypothetical protein